MTATHPEVGVTPQTLIDRAIALRPKLIEEQAATEERTYYSLERLWKEYRSGGSDDRSRLVHPLSPGL